MRIIGTIMISVERVHVFANMQYSHAFCMENRIGNALLSNFGSMDQMHSFESKCLSMIPLPPNINVAAAARATFSSIEIWGEGEPLKRWNMLFTAKYFGTDCSSIFCCHSSAHEECLYSERLTCWEWGWKISRTTAYCFWSKSDFSKCFCRNEMSMKCFLQVSD